MNNMNRIGMAVGMASLLPVAAFSTTAPYAFYPVSGQVVGAAASQWTASGGDSLPVASGMVVSGKANQSVSDDAPGRFIYANGEQVVADCQSYRLARTSNKAGSFTWSDLLENLWAQTSETGGFTIEFFINPAASGSYNNENNLSIQNVLHADSASDFEQGLTVNFVNNQKIRFTNTGLSKYNDLTLSGFFVGTSGNYRSSLDDRWWQIAVTASRADNTARLYVNRNLAAELPWTNTTCTSGRTLVLSSGTTGLESRFTALRVTPAVLTPAEMMVASDWDSRADTPTGTQTLAFYSFADCENGSFAPTNAIRPDAGVVWDAAIHVRCCGPTPSIATKPSVFTNAAPAKYIYAGRGGARVAENPKSVFLAAQNMGSGNKNGAVLDLSFLAHGLRDLDAWTVEWFYRMERPGNSKTMQLASLRGADETLVSAVPNATLTAQNVGTGESAAYNASLVVSADGPDNRADGDSRWHHAALVYDKATKRLACWVDYARIQPSDSQAGLAFDFVGDGTTPLGDVNLYLGNSNAWTATTDAMMCGAVSSIRVSSGALDANDFLVASDAAASSDSTVFHWRFEGQTGQILTNEASAASVGELFTASRFGYNPTRVNANTNRVDSDVWAAQLTSGGVTLGANGGSLRCWGGIQAGFGTARLWSREDKAAPVYGALHHPTNFTLEAFVKLEADVTGTMTLFGYGDGKANGTQTFLWAVQCDGATGAVTAYLRDASGAQTWLTKDGSRTLASLNNRKWHHVALTFDRAAQTACLWFDRKLAAELTSADILYTDTPYANFSFGMGFRGWMDEIRLSDRVLSSDELIRRTPSGLLLIMR